MTSVKKKDSDIQHQDRAYAKTVLYTVMGCSQYQTS